MRIWQGRIGVEPKYESITVCAKVPPYWCIRDCCGGIHKLKDVMKSELLVGSLLNRVYDQTEGPGVTVTLAIKSARAKGADNIIAEATNEIERIVFSSRPQNRLNV